MFQNSYQTFFLYKEMKLSILFFSLLSAGVPNYKDIEIIQTFMDEQMKSFTIENTKIGFYYYIYTYFKVEIFI